VVRHVARIAEFEREFAPFAFVQAGNAGGMKLIVEYVRFASVYRNFQEATEFVQAVTNLEEEP
jgi:hypothetical protein